MSDKIEIWAVKKGDKWYCPCGGWSDELCHASLIYDSEGACYLADLNHAKEVAIHDLIKKEVLKEVRAMVKDQPGYVPTNDPKRSMRYDYYKGDWLCPLALNKALDEMEGEL